MNKNIVLIAGIAGGIMEVLWVSLYSFFSPVNALEVSRHITASLFPFAAGSSFAPIMGIAIHLVLSLLLAVTFVAVVLKYVARHYGAPGIMLSSLITLALVWKINFFVILPLLNPAFISLMPLPVTLISKLLFGVAMGWTLIKTYPIKPVTS